MVRLFVRPPQRVGWCVGVIKEANKDKRRKVDGEVVNFLVHYEIDDNTSKHVLSLGTYGGDAIDSWVLLKETESGETE